MLKFVTIILLVLVCHGAEAALIKTVEDDESTEYFDATAVYRSGKHVKTWAMQDFKVQKSFEGIGNYFTQNNFYEFDCKKKLYSFIGFNWYSDHLGGGKLMFSSFSNVNEREWKPIQPNGRIQAISERACDI